MVNYIIVKYCTLCKVRFVVEKGESRKYYCDKCQKKVFADMESERKEEAKKEAKEKRDAKKAAAKKVAKK